jgi:hypothetical protein
MTTELSAQTARDLSQFSFAGMSEIQGRQTGVEDGS